MQARDLLKSTKYAEKCALAINYMETERKIIQRRVSVYRHHIGFFACAVGEVFLVFSKYVRIYCLVCCCLVGRPFGHRVLDKLVSSSFTYFATLPPDEERTARSPSDNDDKANDDGDPINPG